MKKIFRIPYDKMLLAIAPIDGRPRFAVKKGTIPPGAAILSVHENYQSRSFDIVLQHESFPDHTPGMMLEVVVIELEEVK